MNSVGARKLISNNNGRSSSSSSSRNYIVKDKTPEEKAAEKAAEEAYQKKLAEQRIIFNECQEKAFRNDGPPEFPIKIIFNNNYFNTILRDNNNNFVFASSFNDAVKKVGEDIGSDKSNLMEQFKSSRYYKEGDVLRFSSKNKSVFVRSDNDSPTGQYYFYSDISKEPIPCWSVFVSSAKPTIISSLRISSQNNGILWQNKGGAKKSTFKKGRAKKLRKSRKSKKSRKTRKTKNV